MSSELILAGVAVRADRGLSHRVTACFIEEGSGESTRRWLEVSAPVDNYPASLHGRLEEHGLHVPCTAIITLTEESGPVSGWMSAHETPGDLVVVPYSPTDEAGRPLPFPKRQIPQVRSLLRHVGIGKVPVMRRTWRDLV